MSISRAKGLKIVNSVHRKTHAPMFLRNVGNSLPVNSDKNPEYAKIQVKSSFKLSDFN
jgi:hypothetical protein